MVDAPVLFVHSPLVGPSSLERLAAVAARAGHEVALPDLTAIAASDDPVETFVRSAANAARTLGGPPLVTGHSGAGDFLPLVAKRIGQVRGLLFVDAALPPAEGARTIGDAFRALLDAQTEDGLLRRWIDWWPARVVAALLPDTADRERLTTDMPRLPRAFYDAPVDVPHGWSGGPCAYLRLSAAYDDALADATARGWPVASIDSTHLGVYTEPSRVFDAILALTDRLP